MIEYPSDQRVIESFARIRHDPDFKRIILWLEAERISLATRAMLMDEDKVGRNQGAFLFAEELLKIAADASAVIGAAHERKAKPRTRIP